MKNLGRANYILISGGAKMAGTLDPDIIMDYFSEELYLHEYEEIYAFLAWCHHNDKPFGHGNYEARFTEFKNSQLDKTTKKLVAAAKATRRNL